MSKEFDFWMTNRIIDVEKDGKTYSLARYNVEVDLPRPGKQVLFYRSAKKIAKMKTRNFTHVKVLAKPIAAPLWWDFRWNMLCMPLRLKERGGSICNGMGPFLNKCIAICKKCVKQIKPMWRSRSSPIAAPRVDIYIPSLMYSMYTMSYYSICSNPSLCLLCCSSTEQQRN